MSGANPLPKAGEVFFDARGDDRALRISWHPDAQVMVISIWNRGVCSGTFRLPAADVPLFMESLAQGLPSAEPRGRRHADAPPRQQGYADPNDTSLDGPGPTTQALDALKSLGSQPRPAPQPMHQTGAHYPHPQPPPPPQGPPQGPPPPMPHHAPPPHQHQPGHHQPPHLPPTPPRQQPPPPPSPPGAHGSQHGPQQHGFPATGEYERRHQRPSNG